MIRYLVLPLVVLTFATDARAQAVPSFDVRLVGGALICDEPQAVVDALTGLETTGCGLLQSKSGMKVTVTIIGEFKTRRLAMYEFHTPTNWGSQIQYGFWVGPIPQPAGLPI